MGIFSVRTSSSIEQKAIELYCSGISTTTVGKELGISGATVWQILKRNNIKVRSNKINSRKYYVDENYFEFIDTEEKAYWLGFLYADGYVSHAKNHEKKVGLALSMKDYDHVVKFGKAISSTYPIREYQASGFSSSSYCRLIVSSEKMFDTLVLHGVTEKKTNALLPPTIHSLLIPHFIRGYMDGDGCITSSIQYKTRSYCVKFIGTTEMMQYIKEYFKSIDIIVNRFYKRKEHQSVVSIEVGGNNQVRRFLDSIYANATVFLTRKHQRYIDLCTQQSCTVETQCLKSPELPEKP